MDARNNRTADPAPCLPAAQAPDRAELRELQTFWLGCDRMNEMATRATRGRPWIADNWPGSRIAVGSSSYGVPYSGTKFYYVSLGKGGWSVASPSGTQAVDRAAALL